MGLKKNVIKISQKFYEFLECKTESFANFDFDIEGNRRFPEPRNEVSQAAKT